MSVIGNLMFGGDGGDLKMKDKSLLKFVASILHVPDPDLQACLTTKVRTMRGEVISSPLTVEQANDARDSLAKVWRL